MCVVAQKGKKGNIMHKTLFAVINGRSGVSPERVWRLLPKAPNTSPESWINLQARFAL